MRGRLAGIQVIVAAAVAGCAASKTPRHAIALDNVPIQYGGGGAVRKTFRITPDQWSAICKLLASADTAAEERLALCGAIGRIEQIAGEQTITWMDKAQNGRSGPTEQGQLDCIDESTNTNAYLSLFEQRDLLRWNRVVEIAWRAPRLFDTHRTAVVEDLADGRRYVIDSWFTDNGHDAKTQPLDDWARRVPFPER
jgi:hypothetical protein